MILMINDYDLKLAVNFKITGAVGRFGCLGNSGGAAPAKMHQLSRACKTEAT